MSSSRPRRGLKWKLHEEALARAWQHLYPCLPAPSKSPDRSKTVEESSQLDELSSRSHCTTLSRSKSQCKSPPSCVPDRGCAVRDHSKRQRVTVTASSVHSGRACPQTKGMMMTANSWKRNAKCHLSLLSFYCHTDPHPPAYIISTSRPVCASWPA